jgi:hypothetical protein
MFDPATTDPVVDFLAGIAGAGRALELGSGRVGSMSTTSPRNGSHAEPGVPCTAAGSALVGEDVAWVSDRNPCSVCCS